ncbi:glycosyltransferase [Maribacter dokdonensis]|uniref:glycosyltransferase n=1 Tax=Maribacter dokdonensis TaxID=320912 RepID=UPI0007198DEC|nr:glycosyltransferase [Maribacter dokdonensis]KSA14307.1 Glycosyltransferase [Maribacter dokdonensis DSW-8]
MKRRNKIYYVNPMSYNNLGLYDYSLLSNIKNVNVSYFCNLLYNQKKLPNKTYRFYSYSNKKGIIKIISYFLSQLQLIFFCVKNPPAIIHFQWLKIPSMDYYVLKVLRRFSNHLILTAHNVLPHNSGEIYFKSYAKIYHTVNTIIVHAENTKQELIEKFSISSNKIVVIPHGVLDLSNEIDHEFVRVKVTETRKELKIKNKIVFSVLGGLNEYKGINLIVDTWKDKTLSENKNIQLLIAGSGSVEKVSELAKTDNVHIENRYLTDVEFLAFLRISDFVLLPYKAISQSGVLLSALSEHKRVIVTDVGGLKDPFKFGKIGYVLKEYSVSELKSAILKASETAKEYPIETVWNEIEMFYNWSTIGSKTKNVYVSILGL